MAHVRDCGRRLAIALLLTASESLAQVVPYTPPPPPPPPMMMPPAMAPSGPPMLMRARNKSYDMDLDGFRAYLDSVKRTDPTVWAQLDPKLQALEASNSAGTAVLAVGLLGGGALSIYGFTLIGGGHDCGSASNEDFSDCLDRASDQRHRGMIFAGAGFGIGFLAFAIDLGMRAGPRDIQALVDEHNRINPQAPIEVRVGVAPRPGGGVAAMQLAFF